jgi:hypothetical protein
MPKDDARDGYGTFGLPDSYFGGVSAKLKKENENFNNYTLHNESRDIYKGRYDSILVPAQQVDDLVNQNLNSVNTLKSEVQVLGNSTVWSSHPQTYTSPELAKSAISPLYFDAHTSNDNEACSVIGVTTVLGGYVGAVGAGISQPAGITSTGPVGMAASGVISINSSGTLVIEQVDGTFILNVPVYINGISSPAPTSVLYTGMTKVRADCVMVTKYGAMEPPDDSVDNPYSNDTYPLLDGSTNGVGTAQTYFKNAIDTGAGGSPTISDATNYGKVYTFNTTTSGNDEQISPKLTQIDTNRATGVSNTNSGFIIKQKKTSYAISVWSYERGNKNVEQYLSGNQNLSTLLDSL